MTRLAFDRSNQNDLDIGKFFYRFPIGENLQIQIDGGRGGVYAKSGRHLQSGPGQRHFWGGVPVRAV